MPFIRFLIFYSLCLPAAVLAKQFFSLGLSENAWLKQSDEQNYALDDSQYQVFQYGYAGPVKPDILMDISLDENKDVRAFSVNYFWQDYFFQFDQGAISGTMDGIETNADGHFFNRYKQYLILKKVHPNTKVLMGTGYRKSAVPHRFDYGSSQLQDDALSITTFGIGLYHNPLYHYVMDEQHGTTKDWYFSTNAIYGLSQAVSSSASDLSSNDVDGEKWLLFGLQGKYELGYFYGFKNENFSLATNIGYQINADILISGRPFDILDDSSNELALSSLKRLTHGPVARLNYAF